jgi:selenocysteine-specific elongation factor
MKRLPFILATAGHVDHGKSSLVRALTGTDPDRLPEEKLRGMTIDLGFAHLELSGHDSDNVFDIGIVDVPGHEDFVKNMVAGVGSIDAALLVVAADDGWMPQTEEHVQILSYLGVRRSVVAMTKSDLAVDLVSVEKSIRERLIGTPIVEALIVRTSVKDGRGLGELRSGLAEMFSLMSPARDAGKSRLAVDRAFTLKGVGTVVTGTLAGGRLRRGQEVVVQPGGVRTRVRGMQSHGREIDQAGPGMRVALNLPDVATSGVAHRTTAVGRGDVVTFVEVGTFVNTVDVLLERSARSGPARLRHDTVVHLHHGTAAIPTRVHLLFGNELNSGSKALARMKLIEPALLLTGDRFVIRDWSEQHTLAGGIALDVNPPDKARRTDQWKMLDVRAASIGSVQAFAESQVIRDGICNGEGILRQSIFSSAEINEAVESACETGALISFGGVVATRQAWEQLLLKAREAVDAFHASYPERSGLPLANLERLVTRTAKVNGVWDPVLLELTRQDFTRDATVIRRVSHRPALPPRLQGAGKRLRAALADHELDPPARQQIARDDVGAQALKFLIANGEAVELGSELVVSAEAYAKAVALVRKHIQEHGPSTISQLKTALGSSRRVMVPFVERMDRDGITQRRGDLRILK